MPNKKNKDDTSIFEQFNALLSSSIPEEYKDILNNFNNQGDFYNQLIQSVNNKDELSTFWSIPDTLGFKNNAGNQSDWFQTFFNINGFSTSSKETLSGQLATALSKFSQRASDNVKIFQLSLSKMSCLHEELSKRAMRRFKQLRKKSDSESPEQLCQLWLQAGEETFKEISQTEEYIQTQQSLFDSFSELKKTQFELSKNVAGLMGLPSQQPIEDLQKGLHSLRTEFAEFREQTEASIDQLTKTQKKLQKK